MFSKCFLVACFLHAIHAKRCTNITIPVFIEARQAIFNQVSVTDNWLAAEFALNYTSTSGNYTATTVTGYQTVTGDYNINGQFCEPDGGIPTSSTVQLLIHGIGFDKTYWDLSYNDFNYSYTNNAVDKHNFCTLAIDRFGIAESSHADPINIVQAPATMSSIYEITQMLRNGTLPGVPTKFTKVVHVGHSFGSFLSYLLVTLHPESSDGLILTGFSFDGQWFKQTVAGWNLHVASLNQPFRFGNAVPPKPSTLITTLFARFFTPTSTQVETIRQDITTTEIADIAAGYNITGQAPQNLPAGYLTWSDLTANIYAFLYPSAFDRNFALLAERTKQPVTLGEILTIGNAALSAPGYKGPVLVVTGRQDNIFCGGDCIEAAAGTGYPNVPAAGIGAFPSASVFEAYIQPQTGHGLNFHYNSSGYYEVVQSFLQNNGLGSG